MGRKSSFAPVSEPPQWNPNMKEPWHLDFEKKPVNNEKWSCIVTAAIQAEAQDYECIHIYTQCVNLELRKAVKIISMLDVIRILRENTALNSNKKENKSASNLKKEDKSATNFKKEEKNPKAKRLSDRTEKPTKVRKVSSESLSQIIELAAKYAFFSETDCKLPSDLMAAVLKHIILSIKEEHYRNKKIDAARERKIRNSNIKATFLRNLKPFEVKPEGNENSRKLPSNFLEVNEPINDAPQEGPDLYILLTDFYDMLVFPELLKINVPFLAIIKITTAGFDPTSHTSLAKLESYTRRKSAVNEFWNSYAKHYKDIEKTLSFKDIAVFKYHVACKNPEWKVSLFQTIFNQLTWVQYSIYYVYRQHQKYLQELHVQRLILSTEPLDLSKCEIYNKLCDALVTGEPFTPLLVLYAIVEQVVAGVPETENVAIEYEPYCSNLFKYESQVPLQGKPKAQLMTPCTKCRDKKYKDSCEKLKKKMEQQPDEPDNELSSQESRDLIKTYNSILNEEAAQEDLEALSTRNSIAKSLIDQVLMEKRIEKEKRWTAPLLCFHGDSVFTQSFHCDSRIFDSNSIVKRFLQNSYLCSLWTKYPELPPGERAFFNFHFYRLWKLSNLSEEQIKLKVFFTLSMKLIGFSRAFLFRGDEDTKSEIVSGKEKLKPSRVQFASPYMSAEQNFNKYFLETFITTLHLRRKRKNILQINNTDQMYNAELINDSNLEKVRSHFNMSQISHRSSGTYFPYTYRHFESAITISSVLSQNNDNLHSTLYSLLDCFDISNLTESHLLSENDDYLTLIKNFKFYEKLEPKIMIQRLLEAKENFSTMQCSYFAPTDTLLVVIHNDADHRGIFFTQNSGILPTPVRFRDFYEYVYPEIYDWLVKELEEHLKFQKENEEKIKMEEEIKDAEYLASLKKLYCKMNEENRIQFLNNDLENDSGTEVSYKEVPDLPPKPKFQSIKKTSFYTTNYNELRTVADIKVQEFYSQDGTEVHAALETWSYVKEYLLKLTVKRSKFILYYNQWVNKEDTDKYFTLKSNSDMIFAFRQEESEHKKFRYDLTMSWPTGLLIKPKTIHKNMYIKQGYLKPYRCGWNIEDEEFRCFLKNGQILKFKENSDYEILCPSGVKHTFYDSTGCTQETITMTGEIWETQIRGPCKNKRKLIKKCKVFLGIDSNSQEIFYKREDGTYSMLWASGTLVTNYADGTKITSIPYFEKDEITVELGEEENSNLTEMQSREKSPNLVNGHYSKTILRKSSSGKTPDRKSISTEEFILITCEYLLEHPKYSTVYYPLKGPSIRVTMPENIKVDLYLENSFKIYQENNIFSVSNDAIEFYKPCEDCNNRTSVILNLNDGEILCTCKDFFQKEFLVKKNGKTSFKELSEESVKKEESISRHELAKSESKFKCSINHAKHAASTQRCFSMQRDFSGVEFLHSDDFAYYCYSVPEDAFLDLNTEEPENICHTITSPFYKVGYEKWEMEYEDQNNSLPVNIKRKHLKELGAKNSDKNLFKYPFPERQNKMDQSLLENPAKNITMPKLIVARTVRCLPTEPLSLLTEMKGYVMDYQKKARNIWNEYKKQQADDTQTQDERSLNMRLKKIALTLNQSLKMYPHLCSQWPSTEKDIHYFGHYINLVEDLKETNQSDLLPDCKQIPISITKSENLAPLLEDSESYENINPYN